MTRRLGGTDTHRGLAPFTLALLSVAVGVVGGFGAFVFRMLIALVHNLFFLGQLSLDYDERCMP